MIVLCVIISNLCVVVGLVLSVCVVVFGRLSDYVMFELVSKLCIVCEMVVCRLFLVIVGRLKLVIMLLRFCCR